METSAIFEKSPDISNIVTAYFKPEGVIHMIRRDITGALRWYNETLPNLPGAQNFIGFKALPDSQRYAIDPRDDRVYLLDVQCILESMHKAYVLPKANGGVIETPFVLYQRSIRPDTPPIQMPEFDSDYDGLDIATITLGPDYDHIFQVRTLEIWDGNSVAFFVARFKEERGRELLESLNDDGLNS